MIFKRKSVHLDNKLTNSCESWKIFVFDKKLLQVLSENDGEDCTLNSKQSFESWVNFTL